ncbi:hypothetical protein ACE38F_12435 [Bacillus mycoides]|uniref:hypothetical protein n=2 Tax=Bacillus mycoides TaxID=1405 RepID=UPI0035C95D3B
MQMNNSINYNQYIDYADDDDIWRPIPNKDYQKFDDMVKKVDDAFKSGTKKEKGDSLEELMTYVYKRFKHIKVYDNVKTSENQIDHIIEFLDGVTPKFISDHVGLRLIGESKNHTRSIGSREVSNLDELLRDKLSKLGIFSSYKTFSKGTTMWQNSEGKRRKLALWNQYNRIIIGFTITEIASLKENNFYALLKEKYYQIIDDLNDDHTDIKLKLDYHYRLYYSLLELNKKGIIDDQSVILGKKQIELLYGELEC